MKNKWAKVSRTVVTIKTEKPVEPDDFEELVNDAEKLQTILSRQSSVTYASLNKYLAKCDGCLLYTSPSPRDATLSRMPSSA